MSRWKEEFDGHPIHTTLQELKTLAETTFDNVDSQESPEKRRFLKVIQSYEDTLKKLDPELVPMNQLDALNTALRGGQFWPQITSYASNGNVAHLIQANDLLSQQLTSLSLLLAIAKKTSREIPLRGLEEAVDSTIETLIAKKDELSNSLDLLQDKVVNLESVVETRRTETDAQLSQWQKQFSEAQERRNVDYTTWRDVTDKKIAEVIQSITDETTQAASEINDDFSSKMDAIIADSEKKHDSIIELYELTAADSVGGGYSKNANDEQEQANIWRRVSIGFILATAVWLGFTYSQTIEIVPQLNLSTTQEKVEKVQVGKESLPAVENVQASSEAADINWLRLIVTLSLTGVLLFGAAYSSQQSNRHRTNERKARRFALEMKAFDPFINSLSPEIQNDLKQKLSEKLFGNIDDSSDHEGKVIDEHAWKVLTKSLTDILGKIPRS